MKMQALAASSALGLQSALEAAVPLLLRARAADTVKTRSSASTVTDDEQAARLAALAGLVAAVNSEVRCHPKCCVVA